MAKLAERPLIKNVTPVAPEDLVGDLIQPGHPLFGLVWINRDRVSGAVFLRNARSYKKSV